MSAIWVKDPIAGVPTALLRVELITDADVKTYPQQVLQAPNPPGKERTFVETIPIRLPAGPAVIVDAQTVDSDGDIEQHLVFYVVPKGSSEAIQLTFVTTSLHLITEFAEAARAIADSLTIELGEPGALGDDA